MGKTRSHDWQKLESLIKDHDNQMAELREQFIELKRQNQERFNELQDMIRTLTLQQAQMGTIGFPRFTPEDLEGWLYKCQQFFELDSTPEESKFNLVAIHLEGKALQWHRCFMKLEAAAGRTVEWQEYVAAMSARFSEQAYDDPILDLKNLFQDGALEEYLDKFDSLLSRAKVTEEFAVGFFLGGLKAEIQYPVRMFGPKKLRDAYALAKLQDASYQAMKYDCSDEYGHSN